MKLGIMADAFRDRNWEEACKAASGIGLKAIEPVPVDMVAMPIAGQLRC